MFQNSYSNPIIAGDYPDPSILRVGADFYMTHSSMMWAPGLLIWHSRDLLNWMPLVRALKEFDGDVWAPELVHHEGKFFIYYPSASVGGNRVIVAEHIEGPWSDPIDLGIGEIDPGHVVGPDGRRYLHMSAGNVVELTDDGTAVISPMRKIYDGWPFPEEWRTEGFCLESPKLFFHAGWYHLICAQGGTAGPSTSHMAVHARSRLPVGPWENSPYNPIIRTVSRLEKWWSTGHATILEVGNGEWWAVFHGYDKDHRPLGRQILLQQMEWTQDGWVIPKPCTHPGQIASAPALPPTPCPKLVFSDSFKGPNLGIQWSFYGGLDEGRIRFEQGGMIMQAKGISPADCSPMAFPAPGGAYEIEVEVVADGEAVGGLVLFYDPKAFVGTGVSVDSLWWAKQGQMKQTLSTKAVGKTKLKIICEHYEVAFQIQRAGEPWKNFPGTTAMDISFYHHNNLGGFTSLRPGVFASGSGMVTFSNFTYRSLI